MLVWLLSAAPIASADATITLDRKAPGQDLFGWDLSEATLTVGGVTLVGSRKPTIRVPASTELVEATLSIEGWPDTVFWIELRDRHRYRIIPDPCCFLSIRDHDEAFKKAGRCDDPCPAGTVPIDPWSQHGRSCGAEAGSPRAVCRPPARLRVRGDDVEVTWTEMPVPADGDYHAVSVGREDPQHLLVRRAGKVVWDVGVVVRHGGRYTLDLTDAAAPRILVDGPQAE